jgi:hypothetical protein
LFVQLGIECRDFRVAVSEHDGGHVDFGGGLHGTLQSLEQVECSGVVAIADQLDSEGKPPFVRDSWHLQVADGLASGACEVTLLAPNGTRVTRDVSPADFVYRKSPFWDYVVLSAKVELAPATDTRPLDRIAEVMQHKKTTQPLNLPSAGCIFRNPSPERPAGRLIDQAGLKGTRVGGALVSPVHANYFVNVGGATGRDFLELIGLVRDRVRDACGVDLELEVEIWS